MLGISEISPPRFLTDRLKKRLIPGSLGFCVVFFFAFFDFIDFSVSQLSWSFHFPKQVTFSTYKCKLFNDIVLKRASEVRSFVIFERYRSDPVGGLLCWSTMYFVNIVLIDIYIRAVLS